MFKVYFIKIQAGIPESQLTLALEPEVASIYCLRASPKELLLGTNEDLEVSGEKYLVADIGGT